LPDRFNLCENCNIFSIFMIPSLPCRVVLSPCAREMPTHPGRLAGKMPAHPLVAHAGKMPAHPLVAHAGKMPAYPARLAGRDARVPGTPRGARCPRTQDASRGEMPAPPGRTWFNNSGLRCNSATFPFLISIRPTSGDNHGDRLQQNTQIHAGGPVFGVENIEAHRFVE
jgi:hypothetical protein